MIHDPRLSIPFIPKWCWCWCWCWAMGGALVNRGPARPSTKVSRRLPCEFGSGTGPKSISRRGTSYLRTFVLCSSESGLHSAHLHLILRGGLGAQGRYPPRPISPMNANSTVERRGRHLHRPISPALSTVAGLPAGKGGWLGPAWSWHDLILPAGGDGIFGRELFLPCPAERCDACNHD